MTVHQLFDEKYCWEGIHLLHAFFSIIITVLFTFVSVAVVLLFFESRQKSNPGARINSRNEIFTTFGKLAYVLVFFLFPGVSILVNDIF